MVKMKLVKNKAKPTKKPNLSFNVSVIYVSQVI